MNKEDVIKLGEFNVEVRNGQCTIEILKTSILGGNLNEDAIEDKMYHFYTIKFITNQYETGADMTNEMSFTLFSNKDLVRLANVFSQAVEKDKHL